jgi:chorismate mutase-like protein
MAEAGDSAIETLSDLRTRIDAIDEKLHRLLIERGTVIDALIRAKGTSTGGVAFRPQREAEMMRRLVERHGGNLPLATVEHLWREIITTFTYLQAPFRLVVHYGRDPVAIHDLARFAFGFSVELVRAESPAEVVTTVAATGTDLGVVPLEEGRFASPWWRALSMARGPRIMALWPFIAGKGLPADAPAAIISPTLPEPTPADLAVFAGADDCEPGSAIPGVSLLADAPAAGRREVLVALARGNAEATLRAARIVDFAEVGGIAAGLTLSGRSDRLRTPIGTRPS